MKRAAIIITLIVLIAAHALAEEKSDPTPFSVQMHSLMGDFAYHKEAVDLINAAGIKQVRDEMFWHEVERKKGVYIIPERFLKNLDYSVAAGLDTLIILDYGNPLYEEGNAPTKRKSIKAFGRYCYTLAKELKGKVKYFEVWNEPNVDGFWRPRHDAKAYVRLLKKAYASLKKGNPEATVLGITLAGLDEPFLNEVLDAGGYKHLDVVSIHPYCAPASPEEAKIFERLEHFREICSRYGKPKPIWLTEIGWPTNIGGGVTEERQAEMLARMYLLSLTVPYIPTVFWYWFGPDGPDKEWAEDRFGILHADYSPKPAYVAYRTLTQLLSGAEFRRFLPVGLNIKALEFRRGKQVITALWSVGGFPQVDVLSTDTVTVYYLDGKEQTFGPSDGHVYFSLCESPLFLTSRVQLGVRACPEPVVTVSVATVDGVVLGALPPGSAKIARGDTVSLSVLLSPEVKSARVVFSTSDPEHLSVSTKNGKGILRVSKNAEPGSATLAVFLLPRRGKPVPYARILAPVTVVEPLEIAISPLKPKGDKKTFLVSITNRASGQLEGKIKLEADEGVALNMQTFHFPPFGCNVTYITPIAILSHHESDKVFHIQATGEIGAGLTVREKAMLSFHTSRRAKKPLTVDGNLSDWEKSLEPIRINRQDQYVGGYVTWKGEEDASARVYTCWDDEFFYLGVEFQDDVFSDPATGQQVYNNDGVEVYFDTDHAGDQRSSRYSEDDHQYGLFPTEGKSIVWSWSQLGGESVNSRIAINRSPDVPHTISGRAFKGMIIEVAIPLAELRLKPSDGMQIGFSVAITDDDDPRSLHPFFQEIQMSWTGARNAWQNPQAFADLFFEDPGVKGRATRK